jgi:hypothetical protein
MGKHPGGNKGNSCDGFLRGPEKALERLKKHSSHSEREFLDFGEPWARESRPAGITEPERLARRSRRQSLHENALNYELTLADPLTKLPALLKPLPSEGTSQCCSGLMHSPRRSCRSNGGNNRRLYNTISGEHFAKKSWR